MRKQVDEIQEAARVIDSIADHLIEDHIDLMNENIALRKLNSDLADALFAVLDENYSREHWTEETIEFETAQGNMMAPVIKQAYAALDAARGEKP